MKKEKHIDIFSEEFDDFLETLSKLKASRNDPCSCGSGKKYKKCCLNKTNPETTSQKLEFFSIKYEPLTPEELQATYSPLSEEDEKTLADLFYQFRKFPETITSENCEYFETLQNLEKKYPDNPTISNHIMAGYQHLRLEKKLKQLIQKTYKKFPDYLFAKTAQANYLLINGSPKKAFQVLQEANSLKQLYPKREVFHISEVRVFEYFMVHYLCAIDELEKAQNHLKLLEKALETQDPILQDCRKEVQRLKGLQRLKNLIL